VAHAGPLAATVAGKRASTVGRFAPSPTGPLHFGSLVAALGSFLSARAAGGRWLLRVEDVDQPRSVPGAADAILQALEHHGLGWDGPVLWQSQRTDAYQAALEQLRRAGWVYGCSCSRREIAAAARRGVAGAVYPGSCRQRARPWSGREALRLRSTSPGIRYRDAVQGDQLQELEAEVGDFVLRRADGLHTYQLAVVIDDAAQGMTEVVRGADLLGSTPRQILLQQRLGLPTPRYAHLPVAVDAAGQKLSKQSGAAPLRLHAPGRNLVAGLEFLGQGPPPELAREAVGTIIDWALTNWSPQQIPRVAALPVPAAGGGLADPGAA